MTIILPKDTAKNLSSDETDFQRKRLKYKAKKRADKKNCPRCKKKNWKIILLTEPHSVSPDLPSSVIAMCKCGYSYQIGGQLPSEGAKWLKEMERRGFKQAPKSAADKLIKKK